MKILPFILLVGVLYLNTLKGISQDSLLFRGQLSAWMNYNPDNSYSLNSGIRYIPELNNAIQLKDNKLLDFEASANIYGTAAIMPFDSLDTGGKIKPYRLWARYSSRQFEFRIGLQKINFGSASILRPLMWFDQIDPRDPLKLTDGVWGALARYYFLNNANIWGWVLYGNNKIKGWEAIPTMKQVPEFGGRIQIPVPKGEAALSYHHRVTDSRNILNNEFQFSDIPENRIGFDTKLDLVIGCWLEASWTNKMKDVGIYTNQEIMNAGMDYTFGIGNGLTVTFEQLLAAYDKKPFELNQSVSFSLLSISYPVGIFDNINAIIYYDWSNNAAYNFINWQKQFNNVSL
ncbi:MAG TPA: hypothetical protein VE912_04325, partial [Bacteroidales bacterium]|nr:hypothetical protein [Bacteroidales bacterium]